MDSLREIISDLHVFMYGGMRALPITLAGTIVILGLFTANYAMMFFLAGFIIITPMLSAILNKIVDALVLFLANNGGYNINFFKTKTSDICNVVIPYSTLTKPSKAEDQNILCTTSFAMICFFLGYMLTNAVSIYGRESGPDADPTKVSNRKSHAVLSIASISVFTIIVVLFRMYADCEPPYVGIITGIIIFGLLGKGWYHMLGDHNEGRLADLFGISNRILPASATNDKPVACVLDPNA